MINLIKVADKIRRNTNFSEFYSRYFSGIFSPYLAAACVGTKITPNHLTILMIPSGVFGSLLILTTEPILCFLGSIFYIILNILDAADGQLARYINKPSPFGDYLDRVAHYITNSAFVLSLGLYLFFVTDNIIYIYFMFFCELCILGDEVIRDLLVACGVISLKDSEPGTRKKEKSKTKLFAAPVLKNIWKIFFSNIAIFHLTPILFLMIYLNHIFVNVLGIYFIIFSIVIILKMLLRLPKLRIYTQ